jgi:hypothetical protein
MELLLSTSSFMPARIMAMILRGGYSQCSAVVQEPLHTPHWMHSLILPQAGMEATSSRKSGFSFVSISLSLLY